MATRTAARLIGHRGACAERPENTMPSFRRAVDLGVDVLETDVHMTADGHVVVSHDATGERSAGVRKPIAQATLAEVQSWDAGYGFVDSEGRRPFAGRGVTIPRLSELLEQFPDAALNVDIKQRRPSMVSPVLRLLRQHDAERRVTLASFFTAVIRQVRARGYRGPTVLSRDEAVALIGLPRWLLARARLAGDRVQVPIRFALLELGSRSFIAKCHALGLAVDYWTVNDPVEAEVLLDRGADGIMTDDPARIAPVFARRRGAEVLGARSG